MFKAVEIHSGRAIIIYERLEGERLDTLRRQGRAGELIGPYCKHPVTVKAGTEVRHHFSHKPGVQCPFAHETGDLLSARHALYGWLKSKFGDDATIEKMPDGLYAPRPIDGWVETADGRKFAHFLVNRRLKVEEREQMHGVYEAAGVVFHWIFLAKWIRRPDGVETGGLLLTRTERDCMAVSKYNEPHAGPSGAEWRSLHYLDAEAKRMTTFRALRSTGCTNAEYAGAEITSFLDAMLVGRCSGQLVHPGEVEHLAGFREAERVANEERQRQRERDERNVREWAELHSIARNPPSLPLLAYTGGFTKWEAICIFCGTITRNWYRSSEGTGKCVCKTCRCRDDGQSFQ